MEWYNSLVAGSADGGFQDGGFSQARFTQPSSLALDDEGQRLFVADTGNQRIRVVYLNENNRVETLVGTGQSKTVDGPFQQAAFQDPYVLAWIPPDRLAVYDLGSHLLRLVNLTRKNVSTLGASQDGKTPPLAFAPLGGLVYRAPEDSLYFSIPSAGLLEKMDLKSQAVTSVFSQTPLLPNPQALCLSNNELYIADQNLPPVYRVDWAATTMSAQKAASLVEVGKGNQVRALAETDGILYAFQKGDVPLVRVSEAPQTVGLATAWGFLASDNPPVVPPVELGDDAFGLAVSSKEPRKFYVSRPRASSNRIISIKDYEFRKHWMARSWQEIDNTLTSMTDFDYPAPKPPHSFRILIIGTSRVVSGDTPGFSKDGGNQAGNSLRSLTLPKVLEFSLATQASLNGVLTHFEVLTLGAPGGTTYTFAHYTVPALVKKYGIDLVLVMETSFDDGYYGCVYYYINPLTSEGVPAEHKDPEYLLKPFAERIPPGLPHRFYEKCEQYKLIRKDSATEWQFPSYPGIVKTNDPEFRQDVVDLMAQPLALLSKKLQSIGGPDIHPPRLAIFFAPSASSEVGIYESLWQSIAEKSQIPFLDLTESYNALEPSYRPECDDADPSLHYTAYGNFLLAQLLEHFLIAQKWIPFQPVQDSGGSQK